MIQALALAAALGGNAAARTDFNAGLQLYYAYNGSEGTACFDRALRDDPRFAMAAWGIALSDGPDLNTPLTEPRFADAARAVKEMLPLRPHATLTERAYIDAMAERYRGNWSDRSSDETAYRVAMLHLAHAAPDDIDAQVLATEALFEDGMYAEGHVLVTAALRIAPTNIMLDHLCIHAYDTVADRAPAIPCAQRLDALTFAPAQEHLAHMPAHTWIETGQYAQAVASSERALALFDQLLADGGSHTAHRRYLKHDVYVGYTAAMMGGSEAAALRLAQRMDTVYGESFAATTALRFGRDDDALARASASTTSGRIVRAWIAAKRGDLPSAKRIAATWSGDAATGYVAELARARIAEAGGDDAAALQAYDRAQSLQHDAFSAEMLPLFPAETERGAFLLREHRNAEAESAFRAALARYPNDPRALYGLAQALTAQNKPDEAARVTALFNAAWSGADTTLTLDDL